MIQFQPTPPPAITKETITINGKVRGYVELRSNLHETNPNIYLAYIEIVPGDPTLSVCGFAPTKEAAIDDALNRGRRNADRVIEAIEQLWKEMGSE